MADTSTKLWTVRELGLADFGDKRLTLRGMSLAVDLLGHPQCSIPQACQGWASTKGAYRFFANGRVQSDTMLKAHQTQLRERTAGLSTVLGDIPK